MNRRRALSLFTTAIGVSVSSPTHMLGDPQSCHDHVEWVEKAMERMQRVKVGDTRKNLLRAFQEEGGLSTGLERTYASQDCPYFKVDVKFRAIGRPERDSDGRVTLVESVDDIIISLSRLYLAYEVLD